MTALAWFLSEAAFPISLGAAFALAIDVARRQPVRHYRWRNRRFLRRLHESELRSHAGGGSGVADRSHPPGLSAVTAGVERGGHPHLAAAAPPAPTALVGAADPQLSAPTRLQRVRLGGAR